MTEDYVAVADFLPFWRYAVVPDSKVHPGIPYYRLKPAMDFYNQAIHDLPWAGVTLYRRTWRGLVVIAYYNPTKVRFSP